MNKGTKAEQQWGRQMNRRRLLAMQILVACYLFLTACATMPPTVSTILYADSLPGSDQANILTQQNLSMINGHILPLAGR